MDALAAALRWDDRNTRALNIATQSAQALVELAQRLPAKLAPTIFQVPALLSDPEWREAALPHLSSGTAGFFRDRFPRLAPDAATAVTNIIDRLRAARQVAALLGSPVSTYDSQRAMREGKIVLACPGSGSTRDRLVANLLVYDMLHAFKLRARLAPEKRRPFWLFLDELQTYDGPNLPMLLGAVGEVWRPRVPVQPEPRAAERSDVERGHYQPLAPLLHDRQREGRADDHPRVGRADRTRRADPPRAFHLSLAGHARHAREQAISRARRHRPRAARRAPRRHPTRSPSRPGGVLCGVARSSRHSNW